MNGFGIDVCSVLSRVGALSADECATMASEGDTFTSLSLNMETVILTIVTAGIITVFLIERLLEGSTVSSCDDGSDGTVAEKAPPADCRPKADVGLGDRDAKRSTGDTTGGTVPQTLHDMKSGSSPSLLSSPSRGKGSNFDPVVGQGPRQQEPNVQQQRPNKVRQKQEKQQQQQPLGVCDSAVWCVRRVLWLLTGGCFDSGASLRVTLVDENGASVCYQTTPSTTIEEIVDQGWPNHGPVVVHHAGRRLHPDLTVDQVGLRDLDVIDLEPDWKSMYTSARRDASETTRHLRKQLDMTHADVRASRARLARLNADQIRARRRSSSGSKGSDRITSQPNGGAARTRALSAELREQQRQVESLTERLAAAMHERDRLAKMKTLAPGAAAASPTVAALEQRMRSERARYDAKVSELRERADTAARQAKAAQKAAKAAKKARREADESHRRDAERAREARRREVSLLRAQLEARERAAEQDSRRLREATTSYNKLQKRVARQEEALKASALTAEAQRKGAQEATEEWKRKAQKAVERLAESRAKAQQLSTCVDTLCRWKRDAADNVIPKLRHQAEKFEAEAAMWRQRAQEGAQYSTSRSAGLAVPPWNATTTAFAPASGLSAAWGSADAKSAAPVRSAGDTHRRAKPFWETFPSQPNKTWSGGADTRPVASTADGGTVPIGGGGRFSMGIIGRRPGQPLLIVDDSTDAAARK